MIKNPPANMGDAVSIPGSERSSVAMDRQQNSAMDRIPGTGEPGRLWSTGLQESDMTEQLSVHTHSSLSSFVCP